MKDKWLAVACRWTARILGTLLVLGCVFIAIGEGMPNPLTVALPMQVMFLAFALILIGILVAWRWEFAGGVASLAGWCAFMIGSAMSPRGWAVMTVVLAVPALFYLASAWLRRKATIQV
jgi:hypothetical protein